MALRNASFARFTEMDKDGSGGLDKDELRNLVTWVMGQCMAPCTSFIFEYII